MPEKEREMRLVVLRKAVNKAFEAGVFGSEEIGETAVHRHSC